jgi:hypothetical protein
MVVGVDRSIESRTARQFALEEATRGCRRYTREHGEDAPDVADRVWPG